MQRFYAMAPGGVEPPPADSKSAALSAELRGLDDRCGEYARGGLLLRGLLGFLRVAHVGHEHPDDCGVELLPGEAHQLVQSITG